MKGPTKQQTGLARNLRRRSTKAEQIMWRMLRNRQLDGQKFYRQYPIGYYVVDFCCRKLKIVIEIDGGVHIGKEMDDRERESHLEEQGFHVMRFTNDQINNDLNQVAEEIRLGISKLK
jgi:very-short-patch-repair endonuclease